MEPVPSSAALSRALAYLHSNLGESLSVDDLARRAGMSRPVFDRRFRAATIFSPLQFIKALRLNQAAMQIAQGVNIGQAAFDVGFTSVSQFSREFRRQYGQTPRQWGKVVAGSVPDSQSMAVCVRSIEYPRTPDYVSMAREGAYRLESSPNRFKTM